MVVNVGRQTYNGVDNLKCDASKVSSQVGVTKKSTN